MTAPASIELICPACGAAMAAGRLEAHYGRVVVIDRCPGCGGVWFDRWELYSLTGWALRGLLEDGAAPGPARAGSGQCPRCGVALVPYLDPMLPKDAGIKRCAQCSGVWLDRDGVARYAEYKENVLSVKTEGFRIAETEAARRLEIELKGAAVTPAVERVCAAPGADTDAPEGAGALDDGAIGGGDTAKDTEGG
ncbi:MAG: zf-TFIIB domain-containing protein [Deltaproteobacteria bacterium]|nr:zf-TFIIB domain-containing protein [Deltaproteobacteria bacterium]